MQCFFLNKGLDISRHILLTLKLSSHNTMIKTLSATNPKLVSNLIHWGLGGDWGITQVTVEDIQLLPGLLYQGEHILAADAAAGHLHVLLIPGLSNPAYFYHHLCPASCTMLLQ